MPELPEIETIKNGLSALIGTTIKDFVIRQSNLRYPLQHQELAQAQQQQIIALIRRGKYLIFKLTQGYLLYHLGMSGRLSLHQLPAPAILKHDHVDLLSGNYVLRYNDPRRFGCLVYSKSLEQTSLLNKLGPEPLSTDFNAVYLYQRLKQRNTTVKQLIMTNSLVVGVGNIYASEALFLSAISPLRPGKSLSQQDCAILTNNIKGVLQQAINAGGSSLRDYKQANGDLGYFQHCHNVYGRNSLPCKTCGTTITEIRIAQRNSFYCHHCQH